MLFFFGSESLEHAKEILALNSNNKNVNNKIAGLYEKIKNQGNKKINKVFDYFDLYARPSVSIDGSNISIATDFNNDEEVIFGDLINPKVNSAGYKTIFYFVLKFESLIEYNKINNEKILLIIDELDKNLSPLLQVQLLNYINDRIKDSNIYLILSTHSPFLLDLNTEFNNYYVAYKKNDGSVSVGKMNSFDKININSSYLIFAKKALETHEILKKLKNKRLVILDSKLNDDIYSIKERVNKRIENVDYVLKDSDLAVGKEIDKVITSASGIDDLENLLENNKRVFISKDVIEEIKNN